MFHRISSFPFRLLCLNDTTQVCSCLGWGLLSATSLHHHHHHCCWCCRHHHHHHLSSNCTPISDNPQIPPHPVLASILLAEMFLWQIVFYRCFERLDEVSAAVVCSIVHLSRVALSVHRRTSHHFIASVPCCCQLGVAQRFVTLPVGHFYDATERISMSSGCPVRSSSARKSFSYFSRRMTPMTCGQDSAAAIQYMRRRNTFMQSSSNCACVRYTRINTVSCCCHGPRMFWGVRQLIVKLITGFGSASFSRL